MTEGVDRKPAAPIRAMNATAATDQAGWKRGFTFRILRASVRPDEWPESHDAQESGHAPSHRGSRPGRSRPLRSRCPGSGVRLVADRAGSGAPLRVAVL